MPTPSATPFIINNYFDKRVQSTTANVAKIMDASSLLTVGKQLLTKFNVVTTLTIEFLHIVKHCAIASAAFQEKGGTIVDSSGQRLKCRDCPARIGTVGNYATITWHI